jgi:hypothetical protein
MLQRVDGILWGEVPGVGRRALPLAFPISEAPVAGVKESAGWPVPARARDALPHANVCTITGPAVALAGPASRGVRFSSIQVSARRFDSSAPA